MTLLQALLRRLRPDASRAAARPVVEESEARVLYSADPFGLYGALAGAAEVQWADATDTTAPDAASTPLLAAQRTELVLIDSRVEDRQALLDVLAARGDSGVRYEALVIDRASDGLAQIGAALQGRHDIAALHIVSHGDDGLLVLGRGVVDAQTLAARGDELAGWATALSVDADILLYGCRTGAGEGGRALVEQLAQLTAADVAASDDVTGAAGRGGDWLLEIRVGMVDTSTPFSAPLMNTWGGSLATFTVTNANDTGLGSLREAINSANANGVGLDSIVFNIAGTGIHTINLGSALSIQGAVSIDATTDNSFVANGSCPAIVLNGQGLVQDGFELYTNSGGTTIRGFVIQNFTRVGIDIASDGNTIVGNWVGLNSAGTGAAANQYGISLWNANNNVIGGTSAADRNVISGSTDVGLVINTDGAGSSGNIVRGNYIGTNAAGTAAVGNTSQGLWINAAGNTIGGTVANAGNVISGTTSWVGVQLTPTASNTLIAGNLIGLNAGGTAALGNAYYGVIVESANNTIGGTTAAARNVIAGNGAAGLYFTGTGATGNVVIGNYVGTNEAGTGDVNGTAQVGAASGVVFDNGAQNNRLGTNADGSNDMAERNIISGNNWYGVEMIGAGTSGNVVQGNYIGTDVTGLVALGNSNGGVSFWNQASGNSLGSGLTGAGNVIAASGDLGVLVANGVTNNKVQGNLIGLGADGSTVLGNGGAGVGIYNGGSALAVTGNLIGTDADGSNDAGERNVISGNADGIVIGDAESSGNTVAGNYIGTDSTGLLARANTYDGIRVQNGANGNTIGGSSTTRRNVISGNGQEGIQIDGEASDGNIVRGNWIGVNAAGTAVLGNGGDGIFVNGGADNTLVGGTGASDGNWVAGNSIVGVEVDGASTGTVIQGNRIGTDLAGTANWGHQQNGVLLENGASSTLVGGTSTAAANVIAFSGQGGVWDDGISVLGNTSLQNVFLGNAIYSSSGLGIDLGGNGVTANDTSDADTGPNALLNAVVLNSATTTGSALRVNGTYTGAPNTYYRVEVFSNTTAEPSGTGEGRTYLGTVNMPVGASGTVTGSYNFAVAVAAGSYISATVTRTDASYTTFYETSEFSNQVIAQTPGITVTPIGAGVTTEAGGTSTFTVVLDAAPTANVTIGVSSSSTREGTVSTSSLTFTAANWNVAQTVTVTGADDTLADGSRAYSVVTAAATSGDAAYNGINAADVSLSNADDDTVNTVVVTTTADTADGDTSSLYALLGSQGADGKISLREAIVAANNTANGSGGADRIYFAIAGTGSHLITPASALPGLTDAVILDASTDDSFAANGNRPAIVLDGNDVNSDGVWFTAGASGSLMRGFVIRDFGRAGVYIDNANNVTLVGNFIGALDSSGVAAAGEQNGTDGVYVGGNSNTIGGTDPGLGNVVSSNTSDGINLVGNSNQVLGNFIGTDGSGSAAVPNGQDGITISGNNNLVGGTSVASSNLIAFNTRYGADVWLGGSGNAFLGNRWVGNGALAIDLGADGVTANDAGDVDTGSNDLQNFPVLTNAYSYNGDTTVLGSLNSAAGATYRIEFFSSPAGDASGYGEGAVYLGSISVLTDGSGNAAFTAVLNGVSVTAGHAVTATATLEYSPGTYGSTSEFAANVAAVNTAPPTLAGISVVRAVTSVGSEVRVNTTTTNLQYGPDVNGRNIGFDANGNHVVVWESFGQDGDQYGMYAQRFNAAGVAQGGEIHVSQTTAGNQDFGVVAVAPDGSFVVTWQSDQSTLSDIYVRRFAADGTALTGEVRVNTTTSGLQQFPSVAVDGSGNFVVAWQSRASGNFDIRAQRFNASGGAVGGEIAVNTTTASDQTIASVAMNAAGQFVVVWTSASGDGSGTGVFGQRYNAAGVADGGEFLINQTTTGAQGGAEVSMVADGGFVVSWESAASDTGDIFVRRYGNTGAALTGEILVNGTTSGKQSLGSVAVGPNGNFVVAWTSNGQDGGGDGIYARRYSAAGIALGTEFLVNATTAGDQNFPNVAYAANGDFVIEWEGAGTGDADGVFLRRYAVQPVTTESGGTGTFQVVLDTAPTGNVTVGVSSSDTTEGTVSTASLVFTAANWNVPQTVTVTGVDDTLADGDVAYTVVLAQATSSDGSYNGLNPVDVAATNLDNEIVVTTTSDAADGDTSSLSALRASMGADGRISLREAITAANNTAGTDTIHFDIADALVGGAHTINVLSALPQITGAVLIDASAEPDVAGNGGRPVVVLDGNDLAANGLVLADGADGSTVRGLVIRDFGGAGIRIEAGADNVTIAGNYIGRLSTAGTAAAAGEGNTGDGIVVFGSGGIIGGTAVADRNVIAGNQDIGVRVSGAGATVLGNYIGVDAGGSNALGNGSYGVDVTPGVLGAAIGSATAGNVISGNGNAGVLFEVGSTGTVKGNFIGTDATGATPIAGNGAAVYIATSGVAVGGTGAGEGNRISGSNAHGVIVNGSGSGNPLLGNAISGNAGLGIDLAYDGVTANDAGDGDAGANALQNFPVLVSALTSGTQLAVTGTLNSTALGRYRIEFFANATADASGHGEGQSYLGYTVVTADAGGNATFSALLAASVAAGSSISATATNVATGDTSEFALNVAATAANTAPTFAAGSGSVTTAVGSGNDWGRAMAIQADGRIVVAGYASNGSNDDFIAVRYNVDGSLDTSFGTGGVASVAIGASDDQAWALAIQGDGKIVLAGNSNGASVDLALVRLNADGTLDTTFSGDGKLTVDIGTSSQDDMRSVLVQADGRIVVGGRTGTQFAAVRVLADGTLDTSFGSGGKVLVTVAGGASTASALAVQADGKLLIGGSANNAAVLLRLDTGGTLDASFGTAGVVTSDFSGSLDLFTSLLVQPDGKIVAGGYGNGIDLLLARYDATGALDTGFSGDGHLFADLGGWDFGMALARQADGKLVLAGSDGSNRAVVARYAADGTADTNFGSGGVVTVASGTSALLQGVAVRADGRIVAAGSTQGATRDVVVLSLLPDGSLDGAFGTPANTLDGAPTYTEGGAPVVLDGNVQIVDAELSVAASFSGATLTLQRQGGTNAQDQLAFDGVTVTTSGADVLVSGVQVGTYTFTGGQLVVIFGANATQARVNTTMRHIVYWNSSDAPPTSVQIAWTFSDGNTGVQGTGGALTATGSTVVAITAVNDAPQAADDRLGLDFDGTDDYVAVPSSASLVMGATMTMEAWINPDLSANATQIILNKEGEYEMAVMADGTLQFAFAEGAGWAWHNTGAVIPRGTWSHVAVSYDAGLVTAYVDGSAVHTQTMATSTINDVYPVLNELRIGGRSNSPAGQYFDGRIAEVRVWNTVRSAAEIAAGMSGPVSAATPGLAAAWTLADHAGTTAADTSANGNDGSLVNGAAWVGYRIDEDTPLVVPAPGVLANDGDPEGDAITAVLVAGPAHGSLVLNGDGSFSYTPDADWTGTDSFTYRADDGALQGNVATVTIVVDPVSDAPSDIDLATPGATNVLVNGGFENNVVTAGTIGRPPSLAGWTVLGGEPTEIWNAADDGGPGAASEGTSLVELDSGAAVNGIAQSVATVAGQAYVLSFDFSHRAGAADSSMEVYWRGSLVATVDQSTIAWRTYSVAVTGSGGSDELRFVETAASNDTYGNLLDDVRLVVAQSPAPAVAERSADGTVVARAGSADPDVLALQAASYALADDAGGRFAIDGTTGVVTVADGSLLDFEAAASHTITVRVTDGGGQWRDEAFTIAVTDANDAPVLTPAAPTLTPITEDELTNAGQTVASFVGGSIGDADAGALQGIAVHGADGGSGQWEFSTDGGGSWSTMGSVSTGAALLLRSSDLVRLVPDGSTGTTATLTYVAWDRTAGSAGGTADITVRGGGTAYSAGPSDTATLVATDVNDAPVGVTASPFGAVAEDDTASAGKLVSDFTAGTTDVDGDPVGIAIVATDETNGRWQYSLDGSTWLDVGTVSAASALLMPSDAAARMRFVPAADFNGAVSPFTFRAWDRSSGVPGTRGDTSATGGSSAFSSASASVGVTVTAVNDAPVNLLPGTQVTPVGTPLVLSSASGRALQVTDLDAGGAALRVSLSVAHGTLTLAGTAGLSFTTGDGSADASLVFTGSAAAINAALDGMVYTPTALYQGGDTIAITTDDQGNTGAGGALADSGGVAVQVGALRYQEGQSGYTGTQDTYVDDQNPATAYGNATTVVVDYASPVSPGLIRFDNLFGAGAGQVPLGSTITSATLSVYVTDPDSNDFVSLHRMLAAWSEASTHNTLGSGVQFDDVEAALSASATIDAGRSGWVNFTGLAADVQAWLDGAANQGWAFKSDMADNWTFVSSENATASQRPYLSLSYTPPQPPVVGTSGGSAAFVENGSPVAIDPGLTLSDADSTQLTGATVAITGGFVVAQDVLGFTTQSGITGSYDAGTGVLTLSGSATVAQYQAALRSVTYTNGSEDPVTAPRSIGFSASDAWVDGSVATRGVTVTAVNDTPVLGFVSGSASYPEGSGAVVLAPSATLSDVDSADFDGGVMQVSVTANGQAEDRIAIRHQGTGAGQIGIAGADVTYGGTVIGTFSGGTDGSTPLVISFNANATVAAVQALARNITYQNVSDAPSAAVRTIEGFATDGDGGTSNLASGTLSIVPVNDAPVLDNTGSPSMLPVGENDLNPPGQTVASIIASAGGDRITDADGTVAEGIAITGVNFYPAGRFEASVDGGLNWVSVGKPTATAALLLRDTDLVRYVYAPTTYNVPSASFTFRAWDGSAGIAGTTADTSVNGGSSAFSAAVETVTASVTAQNDAPIFGTGRPGSWALDLAGNAMYDEAARSQVLADGSMLVGGIVQTTGGWAFLLAKYRADGTLDGSFGSDGVVRDQLGGTAAMADDMLVQPDGKIVLSGYVTQGGVRAYALVRYNADGSRDTGFGTNGLTTVAGPSNPRLSGIAQQSDGSIVAIATNGAATGVLNLMRFTPGGALDTGFGTGGVSTLTLGGTVYCESIAVQSDGGLLMAGTRSGNAIVVRTNAAGVLDTAGFGAGTGVVELNLGGFESFNRVQVLGDGRIVLAGDGQTGAGADAMLAARLNTDGSLDTSFAGTGYALADFGGGLYMTYAGGLVVQADGKLVVGGQAGGEFGFRQMGLARFNTDGSLDSSFGTGGMVFDTFSPWHFYSQDLSIAADGTLILSGAGYPGHYNDGNATLAFFNADGTRQTATEAGLLDGAPTYVEGGAPVVLDSDVIVYDPELEQADDYTGATLTLQRQGGAQATDLFSATGLLGSLTEGAALTYDGMALGTVTTNSGGSLVLTFGVGATSARVNGVVKAIAYANASDTPPASVQVDWAFSDGNAGAQGAGGALLATGSVVVGITAVNDAPTGTDTTIAIAEDGAHVFAAADFGFTDVDGHGLAQVRITTLPLVGTLRLNGVDLLAGDVVTAAQLGAGQLVWTPPVDANGSGLASFTFQVQDDGGTANGGVALDPTPNTLSFDVTAVNDAPVNTMPGVQVTPVNTPLVLSTALGRAIQIGDVDAGASSLQVSLSVVHGSLTLAGTAGLSFSSGDGTADASLVFSGTLAAINAALDGLSYTPTAAYEGDDTLTVTTSDLGNTGSGGVLGDTDALAIHVGAVRFQEGVAGYTGTEDTFVRQYEAFNAFGNNTTVELNSWGGFAEHGLIRFNNLFGSGLGQIPLGATITSATLSVYVSHPNDTNGSATVSIHRMLQGWSEGSTWSAMTNGIQVNGVEAAAAASNTRPATQAGWVSFTNLAADLQAWAGGGSNFGWALITDDIDAWDFLSSETATASLRPYLSIAYQPPQGAVIGTSGGSAGYVENGAPVAIDAGLTLSDADSTQLTGATVAISAGFAAGQDVLSFTDQAGITGSWNAGTGVLTLSGTATVAQYQAALRTVAYANSSDAPSTAARTVSLTASDAYVTGAAATRQVAVTAVNDAPTTADASASGAEDAASITVTLNGSDIDGTVTHFTLASLPTDGTLYLDAGHTVAATAGTDIAATAQSLTLHFVPAAHWHGVAAFQFSARDDAGAADATPATATITVTSVNDAPSSIVATRYLSDQLPLAVSMYDRLDDLDHELRPIVLDGVAYSKGLGTHPDNPGDGFGSVDYAVGGATAFKATIGINDYQPGTYGSVRFYVYLDGVLAYGSPAMDSTSTPIELDIDTTGATTLRLAVDNANDGNAFDHGVWANARLEGGAVALAAVPENAANGTVVGSVVGRDVDVPENWSYALVDSAGGRFAIDTQTGRITVADGSLLDVEAAASHDLTVRATDTGGLSVDRLFTVTLTDVNEAPSVSASGGAAAHTEGGAATPLDPGLVLADPDATGTLAGATVTIGTGFASGEDTLLFTDQNGIAGSWNAGTGVLTLTGTATLAQYQAALRSVAYVDTSDTPSTAVRTLSFAVSDGALASNTATRTLTVAASNDAPVLGLVAGHADVAEDAAPVVLAGGITVADADSADFAGGQLVVAFSANGQAGDRLAVRDEGTAAGQIGVSGAVVSYGGIAIGTLAGGGDGSTPLVVSLNANATAAAVQALARNVTYQNADGNPSSAVRSLQLTVSDGDGGSTSVALGTLAVLPSNDAPVLGASGASAAYVENGAAVIVDAGATAADVDSADFGGGSFTASLATGGTTADTLTIRHQGNGAGQVGVSGGNVTFGGVLVGTWSGGTGGAALVVTLNGVADAAAVQALARNVTFATAGDDIDTTTRTVRFVVTDGDGGTSAAADTLVTVEAVNDAPSITAPPSATVAEDGVLVFASGPGGVSVQDVDAGGAPVSVTLTAGHGVLTLAGTTGLTFTTGDGSGDAAMSFTGTLADIDAALAGLAFAPTADYRGAATLQIDIDDGGHTGTGGARAASHTVAIDVTAVNDAPTGAVVIIGTATEDQPLVADTSAIADADGLGAFSYQWLRDGLAVAGAVAASYTAGDADVGAVLSVAVSYVDGDGTAEALPWASAGPVANVNDAPAGLPAVLGTPTEDEVLTADTGAITDADGLGGFGYQWLRDGVAIGGAVASSYTLGDADVGAAISVRVSYVDGHGTTETLTGAPTATVANVNDVPTGVPAVLGTPTEDQTLSADVGGIADADGLGAFGYQWLRDGVAIGGATASSYLLGDADVGATISVRVSYVDGHGTTETLTSAVTAAVANVNDLPTGTPVVLGTPTEDQVLAAGPSAIADVDGLGAFGYQWLRDGVAVAGATGASYVLGDADVGTQISVRVSYVDGHGTAESLTSAPTAAVANVNDAPTGAPAVLVTPTEDQVLVADTSAVGDADGLGAFGYQWLRDGSVVVGATAASYTLGDADVGATISVRVSYVDGHGSAETLTSAPTAAVANVNDAPTGLPVVLGAAVEDQVLVADLSGIADADGLGAFATQWLRDGVAVDGATAPSYRLGDDDVGATITLRVRWTDGQGTAEVLDSVATAPVANVNDAPVLAAAGFEFDAIGEDDIDNAGQTVGALLATGGAGALSDADAGALRGIAVTGADAGHGRWQYRLAGAADWLDLGVVSPGNALLLGEADRVRFVPDGLNGTAAALTMCAWDTTAGAAGDRVAAIVTGGSSAFSSRSVVATIAVAAVNDAPAITSGGGTAALTVDVAENTTAVMQLTAADPDRPANVLSFSLAGADAGWFTIDATSGTLAWRAAPDFEAPTDADGDGRYVVTVGVDDGQGGQAGQTLTLQVGDVNESPQLPSMPTVQIYPRPDNGSTVAWAAAWDPDAGDHLRYVLASDADGRFGIDAETGRVFVADRDRLDVSVERVHDLVVRVSDAAGLVTERVLRVTLAVPAVDDGGTVPPAGPSVGPVPASPTPAVPSTPVAGGGSPAGTRPATATPDAIAGSLDEPSRSGPSQRFEVSIDERTDVSAGATKAVRVGDRNALAAAAEAAAQGVSFDFSTLLTSLGDGGATDAFGSLSDLIAKAWSAGSRGNGPAGEAAEGDGQGTEGRDAARDTFDFIGGFVQPANVASVTVTAGFVWWLTRGGGMLATVLMGVPAWRHIDLLPVMSRPLDDDEDDDEDGEAADEAPGLDGLFDRKEPPAREAGDDA